MVLKILSEETDEETGMTLHQIKDSLTRHQTADLCDDQRIRADLSLIEGLCDEGLLPYRLIKDVGPHNEYSYRGTAVVQCHSQSGLRKPDVGMYDGY